MTSVIELVDLDIMVAAIRSTTLLLDQAKTLVIILIHIMEVMAIKSIITIRKQTATHKTTS